MREIGTGELEPPLFVPTVVSLHTALLTVATVKEEAGPTVSIIACFIWDELLAGAA